MKKKIISLGIETSCDETAIAIVSSDKKILSNTIYSQIVEHKEFGGVVPEIAARSHIQILPKLFEKSLKQSNLVINDINIVCATYGPGLIGGLLVGMQFTKAIAYSNNIPFIAINHLEGHALTTRLTDNNIKYPFLLLLISGGHTQLLIVYGVRNYTILGKTLDDASGEAFDKTAKILNIGYPGGKKIEELAQKGNKNTFVLPQPMKNQKNCDFSFSGLKTKVRQITNDYISKNGSLSKNFINNMCASFQHSVAKILQNKVKIAMKEFKQLTNQESNIFVLSGGVASNQYIRNILTQTTIENGFICKIAPKELCTDNAVMIAWAGIENYKNNITHSLDKSVNPRCSLENLKNE